MRSTNKLIQSLPLAFILLAAIAPVVRGQQSNNPRQSLDRVLSKRGREFNDKVLDKELHAPPNPREEKLIISQIKEDYVRIQVATSELTQAAAQAGSLDMKAVAKLAGEIKKRAGRLKYNLALPKPETEAERAEVNDKQEPEQLRSSLSTLSNLVVGFVNNPLFRQVKVVDVQSSFRAQRDLEEIIALSEHLKKSCEKLDRQH